MNDSHSAPHRYVCVHGHFYQPPRENPWLEAIERQDSAHPYPNWNARITAECYRANAAARIVDGGGLIRRIVNNYAAISFNFGPTLLSWLETHAADVYEAILQADQHSAQRFGGHGSALAQAYNHLIMPLANLRDKQTQVRWGVADFVYRFGRRPEGMWLPETAVCRETLDVLAANGIGFTILAPSQAARVRPLERAAPWQDVGGGHVDSTRTYRVRLAQDRAIDVFFYDGPGSQAVAFEGLLADGARFAERLLARSVGSEPMLVHIATDGESYGHHHRHGEMALAYALHHLEASGAARLSNYAQYRTIAPAQLEADIVENSAWSCAHGLDRWQDDCGCHSGAHPDWQQRWRRPLRDTLDWARGVLARVFEEEGASLLHDPWAARDGYIDVILERSPERLEEFFASYARGELNACKRQKILELLEMQRNAMLMYTSCGWFFDDIAGLETVQILRYLARAVELGERLGHQPIEPALLELLAHARSNQPHEGTGADVYATRARASRVDSRVLVERHAVATVFDADADVAGYQLHREALTRRAAGGAKLAVGIVTATSRVTTETTTASYAALHLGANNLTVGAATSADRDGYERVCAALTEAFDRADFHTCQRLIDRHFGEATNALQSLLRDDDERVLHGMLAEPLADAVATQERLYQRNRPLIRYLVHAQVPVPDVLTNAASVVMKSHLERVLSSAQVELSAVREALEEARVLGLESVRASADGWQRALERAVDALIAEPAALQRLEHLVRFLELAQEHTHRYALLDLWHLQNQSYKLKTAMSASMARAAADGDEHAASWQRSFARLCEALQLWL